MVTTASTRSSSSAEAAEPAARALAHECGIALDRVREQQPLVQCLTNAVVTQFTANALLALGAAPAMVDLPGEAGPFASVASGVLVNLGTPHAEARDAMLEAARSAGAAGTPWVLDPVAVGSLPIRTPLAQSLLGLRPTLVRGNASEILALAGAGAGGRGVDAADDVDAAASAAGRIAHRTGGVVAVSGPVDLLTDGRHTVRVATGSPWLTRITGGGCALGAVLAAFLGVARSTGSARGAGALDHATDCSADLAAATAGVTAYTLAAEAAAEHSAGPGSFAVAFLDVLDGIDPGTVADRARLEVHANPPLDAGRQEADR